MTYESERVAFEQVNKLKVWQQSHRLVISIYELVKGFPDDEKFGLNSQMKRAVTSIPANISEGRGRNTDKDFCRFLYISRGSLEEVKYFLLLAKDLEYINEEDYLVNLDITISVGMMLSGLIKALDKKK